MQEVHEGYLQQIESMDEELAEARGYITRLEGELFGLVGRFEDSQDIFDGAIKEKLRLEDTLR